MQRVCVHVCARRQVIVSQIADLVPVAACRVHACACRPRDSCSVEVAASAVKISWYQVSPIRIIDQSPLCLVILAAIAVAHVRRYLRHSFQRAIT